MQIIIRVGSDKIIIDCNKNDKIKRIKEIIEKKGFLSLEYLRTDPSQTLEYIAKNKIRKTVHCPVNEQKLFFKGSSLNNEQTLNGCGIIDGNIIELRVVQKENTVIKFADVENTNSITLTFSDDAPKWRGILEGFNLFGECQLPGCEAKGQEVICPIGFTNGNEQYEKGCFDMNEAIDENLIKCPICDGIIEPMSYGFYNCEYQFVGQKIEEGKLKDYDSGVKKTHEDDFEYFNPDKNGKVARWKKLLVYVFPKQK